MGYILLIIYCFSIGMLLFILPTAITICCIALLVSFIIEAIQKIRFFINNRLRRREFYGS